VTCTRGGEGLSGERLSAYLDGDLPSVELASVRQHLGQCAACARRADELGALARAVRTLDAPEPPATLWSAIEGELDRRPWWVMSWRTFTAGALAGAAVAALILLVLPRRSDDERELRAASPREARGARRGPSEASSEVAGRGGAEAASGSEPAPRQIDPLLVEAEAEFARAAAAYERSIEKLRGLVARQEAAWSPDVRARYADRLARLDEAIAHSREAARRTPADAVGNEQLFAAYQQKIAFLAEAVHRGGTGAAP
jgi:hypothetical protein